MAQTAKKQQAKLFASVTLSWDAFNKILIFSKMLLQNRINPPGPVTEEELESLWSKLEVDRDVGLDYLDFRRIMKRGKASYLN